MLFFMCTLLLAFLAGCGSDGNGDGIDDLEDNVGNETVENDSLKSDSLKSDSIIRYTIENALAAYSQSGCKKTGTRSGGFFGEEVIEYECTDDGYLLLQHINAIFSCEVNISVAVSINTDTVNITEHALPLTECFCPYDLAMKVGPMKNEVYIVAIDDGRPEKRFFAILFNPTTKGMINLNSVN